MDVGVLLLDLGEDVGARVGRCGSDLDTEGPDLVGLPQIHAGTDAADADEVGALERDHELLGVHQAEAVEHGSATATVVGLVAVRVGGSDGVLEVLGPGAAGRDGVGTRHVQDEAGLVDDGSDLGELAEIRVGRHLDAEGRGVALVLRLDRSEVVGQALRVVADDAVAFDVGTAEVGLDGDALAGQAAVELGVLLGTEAGDADDHASGALTEWPDLDHRAALVGHAPVVDRVQRVVEVLLGHAGVAVALLERDGAHHVEVRSREGVDGVGGWVLDEASGTHDQRVVRSEVLEGIDGCIHAETLRVRRGMRQIS